MSENNDEVPRKRFGTYFVVAVSLGALLAGAAVGVLIGRHRADPDKASQVEALAGAIDQCHHQVTRKAMRDGRGGRPIAFSENHAVGGYNELGSPFAVVDGAGELVEADGSKGRYLYTCTLSAYDEETGRWGLTGISSGWDRLSG
ncbi:hypothetical protein [Catellatospora bangladeshensis]|uniref:Uncharacterized protein n=1 Tax=Catellatospora bangladeshensis TaxID=310355 RepID=A0A8J3JGW6_9ACTN|nr:hypothetical protein [Catellatospora bangladeshensis]GIF80446.1 hypothetical protein Cba03nite_17950 [Catellatospora bangladeshensis]